MAKKKGGKKPGAKTRNQRSTLRVEKVLPRIPHAECPKCNELRKIQRVLYVGKLSGMHWRCAECETLIPRTTPIVRLDAPKPPPKFMR